MKTQNIIENAKSPAHPHTVVQESDAISGSPVKTIEFLGLTKREYFAGLAIVSCSNFGMTEEEINQYAKNAVRLADELLKALEQ